MTKIQSLLRHIQLVRDNGIIVGEKEIENGNDQFGRTLIKNCLIHDSSKFIGIEWEAFFNNRDDLVKDAVLHHNHTNLHHPEYWGNIQSMPLIFVAEMSMDWLARSQERGENVEDWINKSALKRFKFSKKDQVYIDIMIFLEKARKEIN